ncbi:MAG: glycine--tRNA ligase subunit beta [Clostridiales bacterium]|nr:glycine--tRNA ligase subunit beta [Clostridiales bacterium]
MTEEAAFLLEIGCEELPATYVPPALKELLRLFKALLQEEGLQARSLQTAGTPRRLVLYGQGVPLRQEDREEWVRGPAAHVAFDGEGRPTGAALGFARREGVAVEDLVVREVGSQRYAFVKKVRRGETTLNILSRRLPRLMADLAESFPRTMRWGDGDVRFARPVRWILALLGEEVIPFSFGSVRSDRLTYGHRFLAPGPFAIQEPEEYFRTLDAAYVVVDPKERQQLMAAGAQTLAAQVGGKAQLPPELLEEVLYLVEFPQPFVGSFSPEFLRLPARVLETVMRKQQRYFPVEREGQLLPYFIGVRNGGRQGLETVRKGNERVLETRFRDAAFFYDADIQKGLWALEEGLSQVTFLEGAGTLADQRQRLERLVGYLGAELSLSDEERALLLRAARLAKLDLLTQMVREFPELAGYMGGHYARLEGEREEVALAVEEHYLPRTGQDELPRSLVGRVLSLADKLDYLAAGFATGRRPTATQDPFGFRRQAGSLLRLLREMDPALDLEELLSVALEGAYPFLPSPEVQKEVLGDLMAFLEGRLRQQMLDEGYPAALVGAVLAKGARRVADVWRRAEELSRLLALPEGEEVLALHRRAHQLLKGAPPEGEGGSLEERLERLPRLFDEASEEIRQAVSREGMKALRAYREGDLEGWARALRDLKPRMDAFLDGVRVLDEDPAKRQVRLLTLQTVTDVAELLGDLAVLTSGEPVR